MRRPALAVERAGKTASYNWSGWYWGLNGGYSAADPKVTETDGAPLFLNFTPAERVFSFDHSGFMGGIQIGHNWQIDRRWLAGLETDFDYSGIRGNKTSPIAFGGAFPGAFSADTKTEWLGTLRARLGFLPADNFLVYGTGGLAYGEVKTSGAIINNFIAALQLGVPPAPFCNGQSICYGGSGSKTSVGWTAGGGFEYAAASNVTFKLEYLYVNLGDQAIALAPSATTTGGGSATFKFSETVYNIVRLGFNVKY